MAARQCISLLKSNSSRLLQLQTGSAARQQIYFRNKHNLANLSTSATLRKDLVKDPKLVTLEEAAKSAEELAHDAALKGLITVEGAPDITAVSVSRNILRSYLNDIMGTQHNYISTISEEK